MSAIPWRNPIITVTPVEAQNRRGELIGRSQRESVEVGKGREDAARWYSRYRQRVTEQQTGDSEAAALTDANVNRLVHELR